MDGSCAPRPPGRVCRSRAAGWCTSDTRSQPRSSRASSCRIARTRRRPSPCARPPPGSAIGKAARRGSWPSRGRRLCSIASRDDARSIGGGLRPDPMQSFEIEEEDPARFEAAVVRALEFIAAGDVYQANLSRRWQGRARGALEAAALYRRLRAANPSPFAALLRDGDFAVISSSPGAARVRAGRSDRDPADRGDPTARRLARARCRPDRVSARQREGARGARHAHRSGAQRSREGLCGRLGAGR